MLGDLSRFEGKIITEGKDGKELLIDAPMVRRNPYATGRIVPKVDRTCKTARAKYALKTTANEKGYSWKIGYNAVCGQYSPGRAYADMTGSSLNRKKYVKKSDVPTTARGAVEMVAALANKFCRRLGGLVPEWSNGQAEHFGTIWAQVVDLAGQADHRGAVELAMRLSESLRKCTGGVSYGIHLLSARSRGKIKDKATAFFRSCPGDRVFLTLTFIAPVDDQTGVAILNSYLTQLRKHFKGLQYLWVAERQDNGNIHFHAIINKRLPIGRWNALWVECQYNAGLRGQDRYGNLLTYRMVMDAIELDRKEHYKHKRVQAMLNPADVRKIKSIAGLSSYLTKYITSQKKDAYFQCLPWHCSRRVSRMFTRQTVGPSCFKYMNSLANCRVDKSTGEIYEMPRERRVGNGFAVIIYALDKTAPLRYLRRMEQVNKWLLEGFMIDRLPVLDDDEYCKYYICKN